MRHERPEKTQHYHFSADTIMLLQLKEIEVNEIGPNKKKMVRVIQ